MARGQDRRSSRGQFEFWGLKKQSPIFFLLVARILSIHFCRAGGLDWSLLVCPTMAGAQCMNFGAAQSRRFKKIGRVAYCSNGLKYICPRKDLLWRSRKKVYDPPPPENWDGNSKDRFCWMILSIYVDRGSSQFGQWPGVRMYIYIYISIYLYIYIYVSICLYFFFF